MNLDGNRASITEAIDAGLLSGAVTVVWQAGEVLQVNELGYRDVEAGLPMQRDTMFRIASMTKPITVAAAMTLVDEGKLALADPVTKWLPELSGLRVVCDIHGSLDDTEPAERPITVDDLMTHRSGFAYAFSVPGRLARAYGKLSHRQDQDGWLADLAKLPLAHQPGARLTYGRLDRSARHRPVTDRGQAAVASPVRAHLRPARHARHRFQRRPDRAAARGHDVPARRKRHAAPQFDGPRTDLRSAVVQRRRGAVVDGRRLPAFRSDAPRRRSARRSTSAVASNPAE